MFQRKSVGERPFEKNPQHIEQILYRDFNVGLNAASMMADKIVESTFGKKFDPEQADHIEQLMYYGPVFILLAIYCLFIGYLLFIEKLFKF